MKRRALATGLVLLAVAAGALVYRSQQHNAPGPSGIGPFGPTLPAGAPLPNDKRPNIVLIVTDDQEDATLRYMPKTTVLLTQQGVHFTDAQTSFTLCCPSRASILTGQYAHNHGVKDNGPPAGGWLKFNQNRKEAKALPLAMQAAGYNTSFVGKYLNGWAEGRENPHASNPQPVPPGWNSFIGLVGSSVYSMWGYTLQAHGKLARYSRDPSNAAAYQTDVLSRFAVGQIHNLASSPRPFMLDVFPATPHVEKNPAVQQGDIRPAPRHRNAYPNLPLRRTPSFNEPDVSRKPPYIRARHLIPPSGITQMTVDWRDRVRALLSVDDMVGRIVRALAKTGRLNNTVIALTSDNGYLMGQHRIFNGKIVPYGDSVRVPLVFRGPGIQRGVRSSAVVANIDLAPTFLQLAHARSLVTVDGISLMPLLGGRTGSTHRDLLLENFVSSSSAEGGSGAGRGDQYEPYLAIRTHRWLYVRYTDPKQGLELYDLRVDPDNVNNLAYDPRYLRVRLDLNRRLDMVRDCRGTTCRKSGLR